MSFPEQIDISYDRGCTEFVSRLRAVCRPDNARARRGNSRECLGEMKGFNLIYASVVGVTDKGLATTGKPVGAPLMI